LAMRPYPIRSKQGTACRAQISCKVPLPRTQPKRERRGTVCRTHTNLQGITCLACCRPERGPNDQSEALCAELKRSCKAPSARYAAAKSAALPIKVRHCVPSSNDRARHHAPSIAVKSAAQIMHPVPRIAAANSAAQTIKARHVCRAHTIMQGTTCQVLLLH